MDRTDQANNDRWVVGRTVEAAKAAAAKKLGVPESEVGWITHIDKRNDKEGL